MYVIVLTTISILFIPYFCCCLPYIHMGLRMWQRTFLILYIKCQILTSSLVALCSLQSTFFVKMNKYGESIFS